MRKIMLYGLIGMLLAFAACGNGEGTENPTGTPTGTPTEAPATLTPEATEVPATPSAEPTETPTPMIEPTEVPATPTEAPIEVPEEEVQVTLGEYNGIVLTDVTQAEVDAYIKTEIISSFAELKLVERPAENGDVTNINYVGKLDGVAFDGGTDDSEEGTDLELGSGSFIDGFEEGLIGAVAGEVRDLELTFPEDYHSTDMAGKTVVFTVTVNAVYEIIYPEITDAFVSENLIAGMTAEEFRQVVYEELRWESLTEQVMASMMDSSVLDTYPEATVLEEATGIVNMYMMYAEYYATMYGVEAEAMLPMLGFESTEALQEYAFAYAAYMVKMSLVLNAVAEQEEIVLTEEIYAERALEYAMGNGYSDVASFEADYAVEEIEEAILFDLVLEYIISQASIVGEN